MFYCVSVNLRSELLRFHRFYMYFSMFVPVTHPKSLCFTAEMLCFGPTQGPPKGGPGAPPGGRFETRKSCKNIVFYCVSVNLRSELLRFHWFYVYFSILVRFWPGHKSKKSLFYCQNVMFWAHPGSPKGGSRGASGRPF